MNLEQVLQETYGFSAFRPGQREVIEGVLDGKDVIALLPTGMGKSLCYQFPARFLPGSVLIISPLLSLMQDQVAQLKKLGEKSVVAINSFLKQGAREEVWRTLGTYRYIFISPEMLAQPFVRQQLARIQISLLVMDEAHCISQWGFDFRPDYLRIGDMLPHLGNPQVLALTATATKKVVADIRKYLHIPEAFLYEHPIDRKNIVYDIKKFDSHKDKTDWLLHYTDRYRGPGIVYAGTRKKAEELAALMIEKGESAAFYHGGMEQQDRIFVQQQFQNGELEWVCSTNAFGMGVHIPDIRHVIHYQLPTSIEGYVQEVGRAGRDGNPSLATLMYAEGDEALMESLLMDELPTEFEIRAIHDAENRQLLVDQGIVRETALRVGAYWLSQMTIEKTIEQIRKLQNEKWWQGRKVSELVTGEGCVRSYIAQSFDQTIQGKPSNCCCFEGIDYTTFETGTKSSPQVRVEGWQARLARLLPD
ncbi:ATP-dependent DNA helicase RecQ [Planomicrobium sp. YIM 101495]|uniref:RecQ family ATP-dependent DNA helicase n=1 Tax=Planomicrobium sp. YIM 101495 TaxID=2665160 RepID=UPI0012B9CD7D|nr:ATP-dependent DNA helicase RecQ [Planomicrobium sp. YIM 101495]MTD30083.1 RecQ family ATP-dependent DNA helicase [Planomicrobium sp. YIM 101495]